MDMFIKLMVLGVVVFTAPVWAGAIGVVFGAGLYFFIHQPMLAIGLVVLLLYLGCRA